MVEIRMVTPEYRKALGTPLLRGRDFEADDISSKTPFVLVNKQFADEYFHDRDPVGAQVRIGIGDLSKSPWSFVIGVVGNIRHNTLEQASQPQILQPLDSGDHFAIQCDIPSASIITQARDALHSLDSMLTLDDMRTMQERMKPSNAKRDFQTTLLTGFAGVAVVLALAGLYGLMSHTVKPRAPEIAVHLAIGASRAHILGLILSEGLGITAYGLLLVWQARSLSRASSVPGYSA